MCVFPVQEKYLGRECRAISAAKEIMPGPPDFLVERRGFEPVTLGGHQRAFDGVLLPTAHGVLLSCASTAAGAIAGCSDASPIAATEALALASSECG
jgi:hypothetical protein